MADDVDLGIDDLSHYKEVGSGGFSTVYTAWDAGFRRWVAIKVLHSLDEHGRRRFDRERGLMGQLDDHMNVVTPYRFGVTNTGHPYLVMEYLRGGSLQDLIRNDGPIPWTSAIDHILPIANALGRAHSEGIVHRDVKPANILLTGSGVPKLTDFGIADIRGADQTQIAFTLAHVAPETFASSSDSRDERSDLYSLASTLYTLITGRAPFQVDGEDSPIAYMHRIATQDAVVPADLPSELRAFFLRALAKDPETRHRTAAQFIEALETIRRSAEMAETGTPLPGEHAARRVRRRRSAVGIVGAALALAVVAVGLRGLLWSGPPGEAFLFGHSDSVSLVVELAKGRLASASDDHTVRIWDPAAPGDDPAVFRDHTDRALWIAALDDGRVATASADHTVRVWNPDHPGDGSIALVGHTGEVWEVRQLPDGRLASAGQDGTLRVWSLDTPATPVEFGSGSGPIFDLAAFDDGRIATAGYDHTVRIWDPAHPEQAPLVFNGHTEAVHGVRVLGDGRLLSFSDDLTLRIWDAGDPGVPPIVLSGHRDLILSALELGDGRIASSSRDTTVRVWDPGSPQSDPIVFDGHAGSVADVIQLADGRLVSASNDRTVQVWDPDHLDRAPFIFRGHTEEVWTLTALSDGRIASAGADGVVRVWVPGTGDA